MKETDKSARGARSGEKIEGRTEKQGKIDPF
jgi:hypothetical protein